MKLRRTIVRIISLSTPIAILITVLAIQSDIQARNRLSAAILSSNSNETNYHTVHSHNDLAFKNIAIAIKTGREVAFDRIPIQILTFMHRVKNFILVGSDGDFLVGPHLGVYDVVSSVPVFADANNNNDKVEARMKAEIDAQVRAVAKQQNIGDIENSVVPAWD
ncbi:hypothetical protein HK100_010492, partial [Physocladia obscura]